MRSVSRWVRAHRVHTHFHLAGAFRAELAEEPDGTKEFCPMKTTIGTVIWTDGAPPTKNNSGDVHLDRRLTPEEGHRRAPGSPRGPPGRSLVRGAGSEM